MLLGPIYVINFGMIESKCFTPFCRSHAKDKKRQEQKIRERLEEMKRRKEEEDAMTSSS